MNKKTRINKLKKKLKELEEVELPNVQKKLSDAYQDGSSWEENLALSLAKEELELFLARIADLKNTIRELEESQGK